MCGGGVLLTCPFIVEQTSMYIFITLSRCELWMAFSYRSVSVSRVCFVLCCCVFIMARSSALS